MGYPLFAILLLGLIGALVAALYWKRKNRPLYDGSCVVGDCPDYVDQRGCVAGGDIVAGNKAVAAPVALVSVPAVSRNANGTFAKGSAPLAQRGADGRFIKRAA